MSSRATLATIVLLLGALLSCGREHEKQELSSPTKRLLGYHINVANTLHDLIDTGVLSRDDLLSILATNAAWFRARKEQEALPWAPGRGRGEHAEETSKKLQEDGHLNRADLRGKDLRWANLSTSTEEKQDLFGFEFNGADLSGIDQPGMKGVHEINGQIVWRSFTDLSNANLIGAELRAARLENTDLRGALLIGVDFSESSLKGADLYGADLQWAVFDGTDLTNADFGKTDLAGVRYEPKSGAHPMVASFVSAKNIWQMRYDVTPAGLLELREAFKRGGIMQKEREVTFAIRHTERLKAGDGNKLSKIQSILSLVLFEWTTKYGMQPWRSLLILVLLIPVFAIVYIAALFASGRSAIWALRMEGAVHKSARSKPIRISFKSTNPVSRGVLKRARRLLQAIRIAYYFSLLTAFRVGFRELDVGVWIERLQSREYVLRATGWVRTVAGIQSLLSVYLLAMWFLTYFGRPFD